MNKQLFVTIVSAVVASLLVVGLVGYCLYKIDVLEKQEQIQEQNIQGIINFLNDQIQKAQNGQK